MASDFRHLHFLVKFIMNFGFSGIMMLISKPGTLSIYAKLFRFGFILLELLIIILFIFEVEYYEDTN